MPGDSRQLKGFYICVKIFLYLCHKSFAEKDFSKSIIDVQGISIYVLVKYGY